MRTFNQSKPFPEVASLRGGGVIRAESAIIRSFSRPVFMLTGSTPMPTFLPFPPGLLNALLGIRLFISWIPPLRSPHWAASFVMPRFCFIFSSSWISWFVWPSGLEGSIPNLFPPDGSCPWQTHSSIGLGSLVALNWLSGYDTVVGGGDYARPKLWQHRPRCWSWKCFPGQQRRRQ